MLHSLCCRPFFLFLIFTFLLAAFRAEAQPRQVSLVARDGYNIAGTLTLPTDKSRADAGILLLHMYRQTRESWQPLVEELVARGMTTLAIDLRGHGQSRMAPDGSDASTKVLDRDPQFFNSMYLDAEAALRYLAEKQNIPPGKTALAGASVGCSIAIRTAIANKVAGVVVMTPGEDYLGIPTMEHVEQWQNTPLLILTSEEEADRGANAIYTRLKNQGAELTIFKKDDIHGTFMFGEVDGVEKIIADWLAIRLGI